MDPAEAALITEQLTHALDLLRAEIGALRLDLDHHRELTNTRLASLETCGKDHEDRIRAATEGVTQFKVWSGISSGAASLVSLIALAKSIFGS